MQMRIILGDKGHICSIDDCLRPIEPIGTYEVEPLEQALQEAQQGTGSMNLEPDTENPTVKDLSLFYYAESSGKDNRPLFSVYAFMSSDCCIYVPAFGEHVGP